MSCLAWKAIQFDNPLAAEHHGEIILFLALEAGIQFMHFFPFSNIDEINWIFEPLHLDFPHSLFPFKELKLKKNSVLGPFGFVLGHKEWQNQIKGN